MLINYKKSIFQTTRFCVYFKHLIYYNEKKKKKERKVGRKKNPVLFVKEYLRDRLIIYKNTILQIKQFPAYLKYAIHYNIQTLKLKFLTINVDPHILN